ncbi:pur operon repressor [Bacillus subtilis]|jgi:purine operon repressor|uniref:Purine biosynthesis transcriptional repressor PurR n=10 Tax=Bacillus TaxID=1386 RepID=PURR_BACSU|nr:MULTISPECIES: pur operon repressor [Bacillales]NP_387928.1 transcriptional regulator of the purine biosynthesis operon (PurR-pRpp) [Bacillus subtilis subsp. subtilis str. 168]P37551.1 RecName: Full=Pur operon repressor [Bacillus subtilis subsp. subtilis str. 168]1P4A_A Chain A, Pur operon repressor [Bacillus subtilis]1P4A_B Chain B, Pur operon repressor [Bacillus subtilis]1P4A_C Chain C, Pur operon repressor [Bacillus subtilis]1P4A_D Chain D, Pur operon repressor [Bacillus subtilis]7RMW_A
MKFRRSGRLVDLTNYLLTHPHELIPLTFFSERYESAKSSISEDLTIIKQTFEQQGIGTLLTVPGAAGGVKYIPKMKQAEAEEFVQTLGQSLANPERILPGGYVYLTDILGKPSVLSKVGKLFASVFAEREIDVVMTVATKGIPLAYAAASYLNVPVVIVRKDNKVTEGSTVSINYVSGSSNRIQTMSLAKRSMKTGSNVLIIDDFMKAGGTINGMINLLDEFNANVAGIGVLVEAEGVDERLVDEYMSLLTLSTINMKEKSIEIQNGNFLRFFKDNLLKNGETES